MKFRRKIKILSNSSVETGVPRGTSLQAKLRADYFDLSLFLYLSKIVKRFKMRFRIKKLQPRDLIFVFVVVPVEGVLVIVADDGDVVALLERRRLKAHVHLGSML
jgi:hypothetical protein